MNDRLVLCGGVRRPGENGALHLALSGPTRNITLKIDDISKKLVTALPDLLVDLLEIATYVFCADRSTSRGGPAQTGMGEKWRRNFQFVIPVREPQLWSHPDVLQPLRSALYFLSEDNYEFEFERSQYPVSFPEYFDFGSEGAEAFQIDEVISFSGGLDSLSGAIDALANQGKRVALVSHRSASKIFEHQKRLVGELKRRFPRKLIYIPVLATIQESLPADQYTQRSRSFLYAAMSCVVGHLFKNNRIRFFENGVVSMNLPDSAQLVGSRSTRTTHPQALHLFRKFFSAALSQPIDIDNPYIWKTKADVIRSIVEAAGGELIKDTVSCTRVYGSTRSHTHCGCCSQCLDRRFGILAADASPFDPVTQYRVELFAGTRDEARDRTMAESYVRNALEMRVFSELAFFNHFAGETARVFGGFPDLGADEVGRRVWQLHQAHGQSIWEVLRRAVEEFSEHLVDGNVPANSLLMMTVARREVPSLENKIENLDPIKPWINSGGLEPVGDHAFAASADQPTSRRSKSRSRPALERALLAIKQLYPKGLPDQISEPNQVLFQKVSKRLAEAKLQPVSNETIMRAASRRVDGK
jgi:7-cyano-7-deazaguanine synthase in queuosine biosynthesis